MKIISAGSAIPDAGSTNEEIEARLALDRAGLSGAPESSNGRRP